MEFIPTKFSGTWLIRPKVFRDERGYFLESFSKKRFIEHGIDSNFSQDNHSRSLQAGVLRGLHFQKPPSAQAKLVRVVRGGIFDVIVDLRKGSSTFGQWEGFELSGENFLILYVPQGFAHGFCVLEPETDVLYKTDDYYAPESESGIIWNDPDLAISWPVAQPLLSKKDSLLPCFAEHDIIFYIT
jgi:dTDP-4-dehydrorhamnose 3,5-epimerase